MWIYPFSSMIHGGHMYSAIFVAEGGTELAIFA